MAKKHYRTSPIGIARHAHVNKPDTKFNKDGLWHIKLVFEGEQAVAFQAELDRLAEEGFAEVMEEKGLKPVEAKKWSQHLPYVVEEDDEGRPTGRLIVHFKQNAKIPLPDGEFKAFKMGIRDSKDNETNADVWGGDKVRVKYAPRSIPINTDKKVTLRLDFCLTQLVDKAKKQGGGFDEVEGGYVDDTAAPEKPAEGADY
jgi:hypothetical protein